MQLSDVADEAARVSAVPRSRTEGGIPRTTPRVTSRFLAEVSEGE